METRRDSLRAGAEIVASYAVCLVGAQLWLQSAAAQPLHPLAAMGVAHLIAALIIFAFSVVRRNSSFFDAYWSLIPVATVVYFGDLGQIGEWGARRWTLVLLVNLWGWRLTFNWWRQWKGLDHEDWRYVDLRNKHGSRFWFVNLFGIHLFPCALVFMGCTPMWVAMTSSVESFGAFEVAGAIVTAGAVFIEATADRQLHDWKQRNPAPSDYIDEGLWYYSRHPNYFGEITFWWGVWLFAMGTSFDAAWMAVGAASMVLLFSFISIPMIERRTLAKRPHYAAQIERCSMLVPLPRRKASS